MRHARQCFEVVHCRCVDVVVRCEASCDRRVGLREHVSKSVAEISIVLGCFGSDRVDEAASGCAFCEGAFDAGVKESFDGPPVVRFEAKRGEGSVAVGGRIPVDCLHEEIAFVAEGRVETGSVDSHAVREILDGGSVIALVPEHENSCIQRAVSIERSWASSGAFSQLFRRFRVHLHTPLDESNSCPLLLY